MKTFLKTLLALILVTAFLLTGCGTTDISSETSSDISNAPSSVSEDSSTNSFTTDDIDPVFKTEYSKKPLEVTEEDLKYLEKQAPILTEHLVLSSHNLDSVYDKDEINQFFSLLTNFGDKPDYRYTPIMRKSQDKQFYLFCFEDVRRTAYEVFGEREWNLETINMQVDKEHGVYAEEFGYGLYVPYFGTDFETTVTDGSVNVEFTLYRRGSKDGDPHEFDEGRYVACYTVMKDEAGAFLRLIAIVKKHTDFGEYKLDEKKGEITNCNAEEASEYLKTDEAQRLATFFGMCINVNAFSDPLELMDRNTYSFFWFIQNTMYDIGTIDDNADVVAVRKPVVNGYLEKYFGIENYDPKNYTFYDKYSGQYHFPYPAGKTMWDVEDIKLESIEGNECTFRYVYTYMQDEVPGPYWGSRITFKVMKDENGAFLQLVSCTDAVSEVEIIQQAIDAMYDQNLEWQSITLEVPKSPARFVTEDGYKKVEVSSSDGNQSLTFKLPKSFYPNEENGEKVWTDGRVKIRNVHVLYKVSPTEYLEYEKSIWPDPYARRRTFFDNGIVDTILYPRIRYEEDPKNYADDEPSARSHFVEIIYGDKVISFEVSEPWYINTPTMTTETLSMIKAIADSFS